MSIIAMSMRRSFRSVCDAERSMTFTAADGQYRQLRRSTAKRVQIGGCTDRRHELFARILTTAWDTALRNRRRALGRALAAEVVGDDARIDEGLPIRDDRADEACGLPGSVLRAAPHCNWRHYPVAAGWSQPRPYGTLSNCSPPVYQAPALPGELGQVL